MNDIPRPPLSRDVILTSAMKGLRYPRAIRRNADLLRGLVVATMGHGQWKEDVVLQEIYGLGGVLVEVNRLERVTVVYRNHEHRVRN
jgi:hypothetical protein